MAALRCENLVKAFDGVRALDGLSLEFPHSGITAIIGPNGAGKTTLLHVLTGFLRPDAGHCFLGDTEISHMSPHLVARLGIARTFQDLRLIQQVSVLDNVMLAFPSQRGEGITAALFRYCVASEEKRNREKAFQLLEFVALRNNADKPAGELSYGQQKLLTLACCLATDARFILLDEPVAGVAPEMALLILERLEKLRIEGKLIVFIEHDMEAVRRISDLVVVMGEGKVIAQGRPSDVLERAEIMDVYLG